MVKNNHYNDICNYSTKIKQRIPELESCILNSKTGFYIVKYVQDVIKAEWPEAEQYIKAIKDMVSYCAAISQRRKEWEPIIKKSPLNWAVYLKYVHVPIGELKQMRREEELEEQN